MHCRIIKINENAFIYLHLVVLVNLVLHDEHVTSLLQLMDCVSVFSLELAD